LLDEVSMVGCRLLASYNITRAKYGDPSVPFSGLDIIFFGDFILIISTHFQAHSSAQKKFKPV